MIRTEIIQGSATIGVFELDLIDDASLRNERAKNPAPVKTYPSTKVESFIRVTRQVNQDKGDNL